MKTESQNQGDAALREALREWKVDASLPSRFEAAVWRRIEAAAVETPSWSQRLSAALAVFTRPSLATAYLALLLVGGAAAGYLHAQSANAQTDQELSSRYLASLTLFQVVNH